MISRHARQALARVALACAVLSLSASSPVRADSIPSHGTAVHQDPFIPGWPVEPVFPIPAPGTVVGGNGAPPDAEYNVLGGNSQDVQGGNDGLVAPLHGWHWESQYDLDPYFVTAPIPANFRVGGSVRVIFDFRPGGGGLIGPVLVPLNAGPEIAIHVHQPDQGDWFTPGGPAETGAVRKIFVNATPYVVAWGTSVTEDPDVPGGPGFPQNGKEVAILGNPSLSFSVLDNTNLHNQFDLTAGNDAFTLTQVVVPEPVAPVGLLLLGTILTCRGERRT